MSYVAKEVVKLKANGKELLIEPNAIIPEYGDVVLIETAVLKNTSNGKEETFEAGSSIISIEPPEPVTTITFTDVSETTFKASWDAADRADSYIVEVINTATPEVLDGFPKEITDLAIELAELNSDTEYSVIVQSKNDGGLSAPFQDSISTEPEVALKATKVKKTRKAK